MNTPDTPDQSFPLGVIEGMYGAFWTPEDRLSFIPWLKSRGYDFYIYAPKGDACLRRLWFREFSGEYLEGLAILAEAARKQGLSFGIGFTPLNAVSLGADASRGDFPEGEAAMLHRVAARVRDLTDRVKPDILAVLFDDLKIDSHAAGKTQNRILKCILDELPESTRLITCPSFYSLDPILEKIFGEMPPGYFEDFARDLPERADIFWTGDRVMSSGYPLASLEKAREIIGRKPFIWDNYPVNDGRKSSGHLYLAPPDSREFLPEGARGIAVNPMKEHWLSRIPLSLIPEILRVRTPVTAEEKTVLLKKALLRETSPEFTDFMLRECPDFSVRDREEFAADELENLARKTPELSEVPGITRDLRDFFRGRYIFDETCLTG